MIIDKHPLPEDPTPNDAPPSYDEIRGANSPYRRPNEKGVPPELSSVASSSSLRSDPGSATSPLSSPPLKSPYSSPYIRDAANNKGKARAAPSGAGAWFNFSSAQARTSREVRTTVLGLVRDLIQEHLSSSPAASGILQSCADACAANGVSLSDLLQEKSIEKHTPLYWAIVKRLPDDAHDSSDTFASHGPDLLTALISYASPLNADTIKEVRAACLATSDQKLFQRLKMSPEFAPLSGADQMLLGGAIRPDEVEVQDLSPDGGEFAMSFVIPHFHKRMVVCKEISLEFIARARMWKLSFFINEKPFMSHPVGTWCVSLGIVENSPPTFVDSRLVIQPVAVPSTSTDAPDPPLALAARLRALSAGVIPSSSSSSSSSTITSDTSSDSSTSSTIHPTSPTSTSASASAPHSHFNSHSHKPPTHSHNPNHPPLELRLKSTTYQQLEPPPNKYASGHAVVVALQTSAAASKLQYAQNPYVGADEVMRGRLEVKLGKPEGEECVVA